jgi:hypothetical protein
MTDHLYTKDFCFRILFIFSFTHLWNNNIKLQIYCVETILLSTNLFIVTLTFDLMTPK